MAHTTNPRHAPGSGPKAPNPGPGHPQAHRSPKNGDDKRFSTSAKPGKSAGRQSGRSGKGDAN